MKKLFHKEKIGNKRIIYFLGVKFSYRKKPKMPLFLKQDKKSQIEFYLIDAFEIFHFLPIYKELLAQGIKVRIIAEPCEINTSKNWFDYKTAIKILKENKVNYRTKANPNAKIAVTTQRADDILSKYNYKKAVLGYGVGLINNAFGISNETCIGCNARLVHGEFDKKNLSKFIKEDKIHIIGYPKHDLFFKQGLQKKDIIKKLKINTNKPILVYFPTWDKDSSIQKFGNEINKLRNEYFVITKAHHCTFRLPDKKEDLNRLYKISDIVLEGNFPFEEAAIIADIALTDAKSGATTEVPFLNKDVKQLALCVQDNPKDYYKDELFEFTEVINNPEYLLSSIKNKQSQSQCDISYFFKSTYGNDSKIASDILIKEITTKA